MFANPFKRLILLGLSTILLCVGLYVVGLTVFTLNALKTHSFPTQSADAVIILTGGENRISEGIKIWEEGLASKVLITGVGKDITLQNIFPNNHTAKECCVSLGYSALDTVGNAQEAYKWLAGNDVRSFYIVTSTYHMPRAKQIFKDYLPDHSYKIYTHSVEMDRLSPEMKNFWKLMIEEYNKIIYIWGTSYKKL